MVISSLTIQPAVEYAQTSCNVQEMGRLVSWRPTVRHLVPKGTCCRCHFLCRRSAALRRFLLHSVVCMSRHTNPSLGTVLRGFPKTPLLLLRSNSPSRSPIHSDAGGVVQPSLSIFTAFPPEVGVLCLWGDMRTVCLLIADIGMGGHASVTAAVFAVGCIQQSRCSVIKI